MTVSGSVPGSIDALQGGWAEELQLTPMRQEISSEQVPDIAAAVENGLAGLPFQSRVEPGMSVALAVGSRGIGSYTAVVKAAVEALRRYDVHPFLVPAMGSHGGGTAEGQREVLEGYGMADLGVPIHSSTETVLIGTTESGMDVYWDRHAAEADAVIPINRVKAHTSFRGRYESGLFKILAIGLGNRQGAETLHDHGVGEAMPEAARLIIDRKPVVAGIAIVENGHHQPARVEVIAGERIESEEPQLLDLAKKLQPRLPFEQLDLLVIQEMGKDISGTGMDTNVIGMWRRLGGPKEPFYRCVTVLDLTEASHGNATGIGMADLIPQRLEQKIDWIPTYTNCLTSSNYGGARRPITLPTDRDVLNVALKKLDPECARVAYIPNTSNLETVWVSPAVAACAHEYDTLTPAGDASAIQFTAGGALIPPGFKVTVA